MTRRKVARQKQCMPPVTLPMGGWYAVRFRNGDVVLKRLPAGTVLRDVMFLAMIDPSAVELLT